MQLLGTKLIRLPSVFRVSGAEWTNVGRSLKAEKSESAGLCYAGTGGLRRTCPGRRRSGPESDRAARTELPSLPDRAVTATRHAPSCSGAWRRAQTAGPGRCTTGVPRPRSVESSAPRRRVVRERGRPVSRCAPEVLDPDRVAASKRWCRHTSGGRRARRCSRLPKRPIARKAAGSRDSILCGRRGQRPGVLRATDALGGMAIGNRAETRSVPRRAHRAAGLPLRRSTPRHSGDALPGAALRLPAHRLALCSAADPATA